MSINSSNQSPNHNPDLRTFTDYFWSSDRNITDGVNVLYETSKQSLQNTKLLLEVLQEHVDLEKDYNRRMRKLSERVRSISDDKNTIGPIWKSLSTFYTSMNMMHSQHYQDLVNAHKSFASYSAEEKKASGTLSKMWEQANSIKQQYNKSFQHYSTSKSQFYIVSQSVQKSSRLEVATVGGSENPEAGEELVRSQEEYKSSISKHQNSVQQTVNKLFTIFFEFESFEKGRISKLSELVQEFLSHISKFFKRASSISEGTGEQVKSISDEKDSILLDFARRYGPKGHRPLSPSYDDPPNVAELEYELAPASLNRTTSGQSVGSDRSKSGTPKPSKKSLSADKPGKKKSRAFGHKKSKAPKVPNEPSTQNPNFQPEHTLPTSHPPSPSEEVPAGFFMDEDGCLVRIGDVYAQPRTNSPRSDTDSDSDSPSADLQIRNIKIHPKNVLLDGESDNTEDLYKVVPKLQLAGPLTNLTSRKSTSANELTGRRQHSSIDDLIAPLRVTRQRTELEDLLSGPSSFNESSKRLSMPPRNDSDRYSDPDRSRTPTPVDPSLQQEAFPSVPDVPPLHPNFSNEFATMLTPQQPRTKEDDFTFTTNYSNPPSTEAKTFTPPTQKTPLSYTSSSPAFVPLPPPTILPPPLQSPPNKILRPKTSQNDVLNNRKFQIIPEIDIVSPTRSIPDSPREESPEVSRPDSSMSFSTEVVKCISPGSEVVPVAVNLQEKVHVFYQHGQLTERFVRLEGLLTLAFMNSSIESMQQEMKFSLEATGGCKCLSPSLLTQSQTEDEFRFSMDALKEYLLQQRAASPGQSYSTLQAVSYSVKIPTSAPPLLLDVKWDPDSMVHQTQMDLEYRYNPDGFPILSPQPLDDVVLTVKYGAAVSDCELEPIGHWAKPSHSVIWKLDTVSSQANSSGKLRAIFSHFPDVKLSQLVEVSFKAGGTLSAAEFRLKGAGYNVARTKRSLCSGVYKSEN